MVPQGHTLYKLQNFLKVIYAENHRHHWPHFPQSLDQTIITVTVQLAHQAVSRLFVKTSNKFQTVLLFVSGQLLAVGGWSPNNRKAEYYHAGSWTNVGDYPYSGSLSKFLIFQIHR